MNAPGVPSEEPAEVSVDHMLLARPLEIRFPGFTDTAFDLLERLRIHPHIEQYRMDKELIRRHIQDPFKQYRDDLAVNWVLPNRLDLETERNVFSRLLKNDFGAGGCHHHMWMSFYRSGRRRLADVQLAHSIWPDAFYVFVYLGAPAPARFRRLHRVILDSPDDFLALVNPLLQNGSATLHCTTTGSARHIKPIRSPMERLPSNFERVRGIAVRMSVPREDVLHLGPDLVRQALDRILALWPVYRSFLHHTA